MSDLRSPNPKHIRSLSFTNPPSDTSCKSFNGASPSPSIDTCPLDYSTDNDVDSLALLQISPVSACDQNNDNESVTSCTSDPCRSHLDVGPVNDKVNNGEMHSQEMSLNELCSFPQTNIIQVPTEVSALKSSDCNRRNTNGQSPLSISSSNCFIRGIMLLIEKGANVNLVDSFGRTPLHLVCENTESSEHHECISYLLDHGADTSCQGECQNKFVLALLARVISAHWLPDLR